MNEAAVRQEVYGLLRRLWYTPHRLKDAILCPKCGAKILPPTGRPDILVNSAYGPGAYIEVKVLKAGKSFPFKAITPEQRQYLCRRTEEKFRCYLALGTVDAPRGGRHLWIVDWRAWVLTEILVSTHQKSIPEIAGPGFKKVLQEEHLDLVHLLADYECYWENGLWHLPKPHSLWHDYDLSLINIPIGEKEL